MGRQRLRGKGVVVAVVVVGLASSQSVNRDRKALFRLINRNLQVVSSVGLSRQLEDQTRSMSHLARKP